MTRAWDRGEYNARLTEIQGRLADLRAIDLFVTGNKADAGTWPLVPDGDETGGGLPFGPSSIEIGNYYPFRMFVHLPAANRSAPKGSSPLGGTTYSSEQEAADRSTYINGIYGAADAYAAQIVSEVKSSMTYITEPTASQFSDAADRTKSQLCDVLEAHAVDDFALLEHSLADWHGAAANQFADYVYNLMQAAITEQRVAAETMRYGLAGGFTIVNLAQNSLMQLVDSVYEVLDAQLQQRQKDHESTSPSLSTWLAIASGVIAVVAAIPTGGASLEIAVGVAGAASGVLGVGSALTADNGSEQKIEEYSAEKIGDKFVDGMSTIYLNAQTNWTRLESNMSVYRRHIDHAEADKLMFPQRPDIADGVTPHSFHHDSVNY